MATLSHLFARYASSAHVPHSVILKVDIEGAEFDVLPLTEEQCRAVSLLVVEFHALDANWERFVGCVSQLERHFRIVHVHGNNFAGVVPGTEVPRALEVTFLNRSLLSDAAAAPGVEYPLQGLDMPNNWQKPDLRLSFD
jgi:hypothetical protein